MEIGTAVLSDERVSRACGGDRAALDGLIQEWQPVLYAAALRLLAYRHHDAEEAVQETWVQVCDSIAALREPARWAAWIHRILRNVCFKRRGREKRPLPDRPPAATAEPADLRPLARAIQSMPDAYREAVILRYLQKMEYAQIADVLDIAVGTAKSNVHRGLAWLEKHLTKE